MIPSYSKLCFKWHCMKSLIREWGDKRQCRIVLFISVNISRANGAMSTATKPFRAIWPGRSQDLEKGGAFLKEWEKCKQTWPEFSLFLNQNFSESLEIQTFFPPKNRWSQKKKKKRVFTGIETDFSAKIGYSNAFSGRITTCISQLRNPISYGGAVFNFSPKIGLKSTKTCDFAYFTSQWGGSSPPPPPLATQLYMTMFLGVQTQAFLLRHDRAYLNVDSEESIMCVIMKCNQGRQEGAGGTMTPGPKDFWGPMGFIKTVRISVKNFFSEITQFWPEKPWEFRWRSFFLQIASFFGPNYSIFSVYVGLHKTGNPSYLSWPRPVFGPRRHGM